jgi:hypothetical protein
MREFASKDRLINFMQKLGEQTQGVGKVYLVGGSCALFLGWREMTIDIDLHSDPEPKGFFEVIAALKENLDVNVELVNLSQFIPVLPGWRDRSTFIVRHGQVDFYHYDFYSQALSKLQRGHARDVLDVEAMSRLNLIEKETLFSLFEKIESNLIRYPSLDAPSFRKVVQNFCDRV